MSKSALRRRAKEARHWLFDACFPLWSERGLNESGLFLDALSLDHTPMPSETLRVGTQARQTSVFAQAGRLGWKPDTARDLVEDGVRTLSGLARREDGLIARALTADAGGIADATPHLEDLAASLHALALSSEMLEDGSGVIASLRALLDALDRRMKDRTNGGYAETLPMLATRQQAPHMQLLEACLALHRADPEGDHLPRASELVTLFHEKFTAGPGGLLGEEFGPDWSEAEGDAARLVEPSHQFQWVWLLGAFASTQFEPMAPIAGRLYSFATGTLDEEGRTLQQVSRDGEVKDSGRQTSAQTEALRAHLTMLEMTDDDAVAAAACTSFDILMDEHLTPEGGWIDTYDGDGHIISSTIPASTGHDVVRAFSELIRVMNA